MFYNSELMTNGVLRDAWLTGNHQESRVEGATNIAHICNEVSARLCYKSARHRLSLRSSAVLLSGTARIYKHELDALYQDCVELDRSMISRRVSREVSSQVSPGVSQVSSSSDSRLISCDGKENVEPMTADENQDNTTVETDSKKISSISSNHSNGGVRTKRRSRISRSAKGTQTTMYIRPGGIDPGLPVGVTTVYDGESRVPVGVLCYNINPDIRRLYRRM
ncbi:uncharacterized protein LOC121727829 isoform X2 [Aricia agestis]|uniref:uncharacterized protein LOC121727829 isoform X2 n=1 Tax=Aricia agestis TaxID=91739 RepID=UPI001C209BF1|nr:uncharacterized protein LOC121727829 isoform X2 [Aricia agestis]